MTQIKGDGECDELLLVHCRLLRHDSELEAARRICSTSRKQAEQLQASLSQANSQLSQMEKELEEERSKPAPAVDASSEAMEGMEAALVRVTDILRRKEVGQHERLPILFIVTLIP